MKRILFADDNRHLREFFKEELEGQGHRVLLARDGREASELAEREPLDLAILDLNMPNMNGVEAAERIHATAPSLAIMFFSAHVEDWPVDGRRLGAACVRKTNDLAEFRKTVDRLLARP